MAKVNLKIGFPYQETDDQLRCIEEVKKTWKVKDQWTDYLW